MAARNPLPPVEMPPTAGGRPLQKVETAPKPQGYNKLSRLMGPNAEVAIFRRFGSLQMINLLYMQAELMELERKFEGAYLDDSTSKIDGVRDFHRNFEALRNSGKGLYKDQLEQLLQIKTKLAEYNEALLAAAGVLGLTKPDKADVKRLRDWLQDKDGGSNFLLDTESLTWSRRHEGDLIALSPPPSDNESLLPTSLSSWPLDVFHFCFGGRPGGHRKPDEETGVFVYDDVKLRRFNKFVTTTVASLLPIVAIVVLYAVIGTWRRIGVMVGFTTAFAMVFAATSARKAEIFAATAAFSAVEVVFIGSVSNSTGG